MTAPRSIGKSITLIMKVYRLFRMWWIWTQLIKRALQLWTFTFPTFQKRRRWKYHLVSRLLTLYWVTTRPKFGEPTKNSLCQGQEFRWMRWRLSWESRCNHTGKEGVFARPSWKLGLFIKRRGTATRSFGSRLRISLATLVARGFKTGRSTKPSTTATLKEKSWVESFASPPQAGLMLASWWR